MGFSQTWIDIVNDRWGEGLEVRLSARDGSNNLVRLTDLEDVIEVSELRRERERIPGVVQGQTWQIRLTNLRGTFNRNSPNYWTSEGYDDVIGKWVVLELGFSSVPIWEEFATGQIEDIKASLDGSAVILLEDIFVASIHDWKLTRPLLWDNRDAWASPVYSEEISSASSEYDNAAGVGQPLNLNAGVTSWETFEIEFVSTTTFEVWKENGTKQTGGPFPISSNLDITSIYSLAAATVRIFANGWSGTYATGDRFVVYTSHQATTENPITVIERLIELCLNDGQGTFPIATVPDVLNGGTRDWRFDGSNWTALTGTFGPLVQVRGFFPKGTRVIDMIQGLLRLTNTSLWTERTGQIAIYSITADGVGDTAGRISGDPDRDPVLMEGERSTDRRFRTNEVLYAYRVLNFTAGQDGRDLEGTQPTSSNPPEKLAISRVVLSRKDGSATGRLTKEEVDLLWAAKATAVDSAASKHLTRFTEPMPTYTLHGSISNIATREISDAVSVTEFALDEVDSKFQIVELAIDPISNEATAVVVDDPIVSQNYAIVGVSVVGGADGHVIF